jgi:hypothetical protein
MSWRIRAKASAGRRVVVEALNEACFLRGDTKLGGASPIERIAVVALQILCP